MSWYVGERFVRFPFRAVSLLFVGFFSFFARVHLLDIATAYL